MPLTSAAPRTTGTTRSTPKREGRVIGKLPAHRWSLTLVMSSSSVTGPTSSVGEDPAADAGQEPSTASPPARTPPRPGQPPTPAHARPDRPTGQEGTSAGKIPTRARLPERSSGLDTRRSPGAALSRHDDTPRSRIPSHPPTQITLNRSSHTRTEHAGALTDVRVGDSPTVDRLVRRYLLDQPLDRHLASLASHRRPVPCPRSRTTSRVAGDDLRVRDQCDGDLRGAAEPRVQPLLEDRRAGGGRALSVVVSRNEVEVALGAADVPNVAFGAVDVPKAAFASFGTGIGP